MKFLDERFLKSIHLVSKTSKPSSSSNLLGMAVVFVVVVATNIVSQDNLYAGSFT